MIKKGKPQQASKGVFASALEAYQNKKLNLQLESETRKAAIYKIAVFIEYFLLNMAIPGIQDKPAIQIVHIVNFQKAGSIVFLGSISLYLEAFEPIHLVYVALHGGYGIVWIIKFFVFRDKRFDIKVPVGTAVVLSTVLLLYWGIGVLCLTKKFENNHFTAERIFWAILLNLIGSVIVFGSDIQKGTQLSLKKGLVSTGLFSRTRNPNYLGELLVYLAFGVLSADWRAYAFLIFVWSTLFIMFMVLKELSFMQKKGWIEYREKSLMFLPRLFRGDDGWNWGLNYLVYGLLAVGVKLIYDNGGVLGLYFKLVRG